MFRDIGVYINDKERDRIIHEWGGELMGTTLQHVAQRINSGMNDWPPARADVVGRNGLWDCAAPLAAHTVAVMGTNGAVNHAIQVRRVFRQNGPVMADCWDPDDHHSPYQTGPVDQLGPEFLILRKP
eukprot:EG_transcript_25550